MNQNNSRLELLAFAVAKVKNLSKSSQKFAALVKTKFAFFKTQELSKYFSYQKCFQKVFLLEKLLKKKLSKLHRNSFRSKQKKRTFAREKLKRELVKLQGGAEDTSSHHIFTLNKLTKESFFISHHHLGKLCSFTEIIREESHLYSVTVLVIINHIGK